MLEEADGSGVRQRGEAQRAPMLQSPRREGDCLGLRSPARARLRDVLKPLLFGGLARGLGLGLLWLAACATRPPGAHEAPVEPGVCAADHDCASGFCDRGVCAVPEQDASRGPGGVLLGGPCVTGYKGALCQNLMCIDGRCRSCSSDVECDPSGSHRDIRCENRRCISTLELPRTVATPPPGSPGADHPFAPE
jgi:hypothetical protein